ncbi:MAG: hypothetical protein US86_C0001G0384 [Candidatus Daviesbacteria bacterium GW2011_GWA2_38_24]|uniref:Baseplate protein J-like domain-containing protein n=1 Tax=Candidatus Daviesbacteria bacterium GW2011_GWA2_38_24 TaxID=1618422 RepID=A0A0G0JKR1_9BACT|nr:MAG: hypothetical protein US86_C0001G0384 [Candidatus Daviesbacteria bacterium GW2011_GWA2_38_24]OGE23264.1 MAG: hypothetical protein A2688_03310 [Candidatus Daviesbacteria bacterium RIFCSPHIGHO2_01_FULL_38_8]
MSLLDNLPKSLPFGKKEDLTEYFFGLNIGFNTVTGCLWGIEHKRLHVIRAVETEYTDETLKDSANAVLDEVLGDFEHEPTKVLFGVPDSWLQDDNLKDEHLKLLRDLVKELDLSPMAYVSTSYAIAHLMQKVTGVPLTAILLNVSEPLVVTVVKAGKIVGSKVLKRSGDLPQDTEKALLGINDIEVLPSKFLIYSSNVLEKEQLEKFKDELQSFSWMNSLPFLHLPKIEVLEDSVETKAISLAGASELEPDISYHPQPLQTQKFEAALESTLSPAKEHLETEQSDQPMNESGFVEGDIEEVERDKRINNIDPIEIDSDYSTLPVGFPTNRPLPPQSRKFSLKLPKFNLGHFNKIFLGLIIVVVVSLAGYVVLPKATVSIYVDPKVLENAAQVVADPSLTSVDEENKKIPGQLIEVEVSGTEKSQATGKKQIGDPAKGKVVILNKTNASKNFPQGTVLNGSDGINYTLDNGVTVASQSAVADGISFGKTTVSVTSTKIGPEGNLSAGKELSIKGESSSNYSARVDSDISGGTSKDVTVVTSDDQKKLLAALSSQLKKKAKEEIQGKLQGDAKILEEALNETITKTSYSKSVNDQAPEFSLTLNARYKGTAYSENDLRTIVSKLVQTNVPENFALNLADTETQSDVMKLEKDNKLVFQAKFRAKLMPKLDIEKIKMQIKGKTPSEVAEIVRQYESVIGSEVRTSSTLPASLQRLPILSKNISIEVVTK